ncbi:MAG: hypothetical protein GY793_12015 [Proteobacteria bacterium]|nr:hypothetical protein [Pseudomonadota bacterium]
MSIQTASKALSLKADPIFKLLVIMLILLGWITSMGGASIVGLENLYKQWDLTQKSKVNVYLMAQTDAKLIDNLSQDLLAESYITGIKRVKDEETEKLLEPFLMNDLKVQLPKVLELQTTKATKFEKIKSLIKSQIPHAQVDDPSETLNSIANGVRFSEELLLGTSLLIVFVISLIVALTTRAGLRAQRRQVEILQFVGASDSFIALLTVKQVLFCSFIGYLGSLILSIISIYIVKAKWIIVSPFILPNVWFVIFCIPLFICLVSVFVSMSVAKKVVRGK